METLEDDLPEYSDDARDGPSAALKRKAATLVSLVEKKPFLAHCVDVEENIKSKITAISTRSKIGSSF
jgi:hypothetical protein